MESFRRWSIGGSAGEGVDETGSQEDGKNSEVLSGMVYGDAFVTRSEGILYERAEVVW